MHYTIITTTVDADTLESAQSIMLDDHGHEYLIQHTIPRGSWLITTSQVWHARSTFKSWEPVGDPLRWPDPDMLLESRADVLRLVCQHLSNALENEKAINRRR